MTTDKPQRPRLTVEKAPAQYKERLTDFLRWLAQEWPPTRSVRVHFLNKPVGDGGTEAPFGIADGGKMLYVAAAQPGASWVAIAEAAAEAYASAVRFAPERRLWARRALLRYRELNSL